MTINLFCENGLGNDTIVRVMEGLLADENTVRGKTVLLKPNMVDPSIPQACSDRDRLQVAIDVLNSNGAAEVLVGDEPAHYFFEVEGGIPDMSAHYDAIGYSTLRGARTVDLRTLRGIFHYNAERINPLTGAREMISVPVRDTTGMVVVSFTLPKQHGNYNYSGVLKNLMGLVPEADRGPAFHYSFREALRSGDVPVGVIYNFVEKVAELTGENKCDPRKGVVAPVFNAYLNGDIDIISLECHLEHIVNAGSLGMLNEYVKGMSPGSFGVLDGTYMLEKHEHDGNRVDTGFAIAGQSLQHVDILACEKLGINPLDIPYFTRTNLSGTPNVTGSVGAIMPRAVAGSMFPKELFADSHGLHFLRIK